MSLFEITTNLVGESYVRAYAWAEDEVEARELFAAQNPGHKIAFVRELFTGGDPPFCTKADDAGWGGGFPGE